MAAPMLVTSLQLSVKHRFVLYLWKRSLQNSAVLCAGQDWRIQHGFARSGSEYGPLTDLADWSFAGLGVVSATYVYCRILYTALSGVGSEENWTNGRPAPQWKAQIKRKEENKALASRIVLLSNEIDQGMKKWEDKQEKLREGQLLKEKSQLKTKALYKKCSKPK